MATSRGIETNVLLAELIEVWARKHGLMANPYIQRLILDLLNQKQMNMWMSMDPFEFLPYPQSRKGEAYARLARNLIIWRNSMVFLPAVITWLAFGQSTAAFGKYTSENLDAQVNFLQFWENGFGYLSNFWQIGNVTLIATLSILGVILFTIGINYSQRISEKLTEEDEELLLNERTQVGFAIKDFFYAKSNASRYGINRKVLNAAENMIDRSERLQRQKR